MAYTPNPSLNTYSTKRIALVTNPQQRSGLTPSKDARLVNMMPELLATPAPDGKKFVIKSRPGLSSAYVVNAGEARGIYNWLFSGVNYVFSVVANKVYINGVDSLTLTTSTGIVGFAEHLSSIAADTLVLVDGVKGYVFFSPLVAPISIIPAVWATGVTLAVDDRRMPTTANDLYYVVQSITTGITGGTEPMWPLVIGDTIVDGGVTWETVGGAFPTPHVPFPIFLDGYIFLAKADTQDVYNSNLDDPKAWTAGDYFSAEMYPDKVVAMSKNNNYMYAIGSGTIEYLYDDAVATGSPLGRHQSAVQQFGCVAPGTVVPTDKEVFMVGQSAAGGYTVWSIDGFKEKEISIPSVRNALLAEGTSLVNAKAFSVRVASQKLYVLTLTSRTFVYSLDTEIWSEWASGATSAVGFIGSLATDGPTGTPYVLNRLGGVIYTMNENVFTDAGTAYRCEIVTEKQDFDTINRKWMSRLAIIGDVPDSTGTDNSISIEWSDDDYNTWSAARNLSFNNDFPVLRQLGSFRRRAFRLRYSLPHLLRFEGLEADINKGQQ